MEPMFSEQWYRIAAKKPRLRANIHVRRQVYRHKRWHLLSDESTHQTFRLDSTSYAFIGRCDGTTTAEEIWNSVAHELGEKAPTQDALLRLMIRLQTAGFLHFDKSTDIASLFPTRKENLVQKGKKLNPFAFKINLGNPTRVLKALSPLEKILFQPAAFLMWGCVIIIAAILALVYANELFAHARQVYSQPQQLWLMWLIYPIVKLIHELSHGLAVRRWGGEIREWGLTIMVLMPIPFVNASAANDYALLRRATVSAAGIMAELFIAVIALSVWLSTQPGLVKDIAFLTMMICAVSTLLVNGNPLLRFDGYFLFTDLLQLPNLGTRSSKWWQQHLRQWLQGLPPLEEVHPAEGELFYLIAYQPLSWLYRVLLMTGIILWLGTLLPVLALIAGIWFAWLLLIRPLYKAFKSLTDKHLPDYTRVRSRAIAGLFATSLILVLFVMPFKNTSVMQGITWLPDSSQLRNETAGFIEMVHVQQGDRVQAGDLILTLTDPVLITEAERLNLEKDALTNLLFQHFRSDTIETAQLARRIEQLERELTFINTKILGLEVRAKASGQLHLPRSNDLVGRFVQRGETLGAILDGSPIVVRTVLPHHLADQLTDIHDITVRLAEKSDISVAGTFTGRMTSARHQLPDIALGQPAGGRIPVDPLDPSGLTTLTPIIWKDILLPNTEQMFAGGRAWVRFEHTPQPIAWQFWHHIRQLFLGRFSEGGV